jgi:hypothetical protein
VYAAITTLTVTPMGPAGDVSALLRSLVGRTCPAAFEAGMLDATVLHLPPDRIVMISIYDSETGAITMGPTVERTIITEFAGTLHWERRVIGYLYNALLPDESALAWRAGAPVMHATWAVWRVGPHLRTTEALERYIAEGYRRLEPMSRRLGLVDRLVIRYGNDELAVLNLYPEPVLGHAAYEEVNAVLADYAAGHIERIETRTGQAFDLAMLLARAV